jgi:hypothetical protein
MVMGLKIWSLSNLGFEPATFRSLAQRAYQLPFNVCALFTLSSALVGYATTVIPRWLTYYASSILFAVFGLKMLKEGERV